VRRKMEERRTVVRDTVVRFMYEVDIFARALLAGRVGVLWCFSMWMWFRGCGRKLLISCDSAMTNVTGTYSINATAFNHLS
jgi:hypothetical protein